MEKRKITAEEVKAHTEALRKRWANDNERTNWCGTPKVLARMMREQEEASKNNAETQPKSNK